MCETVVIIGSDGLAMHTVETVSQAVAQFPSGLVWDDFGTRTVPPQDDECLCWLDMAATAHLNGYTTDNQQHGGDPFEWHFKRKQR